MKTTLFLLLIFFWGIITPDSSGSLHAQAKQQINQVLTFNEQVASPLLIYTFLPLPGERPAIISVDFAGGHNRFFSESPIVNNTVDMGDGKGRFGYTCLGKTTNNIYVVRTTLENGNSLAKALLFFSIQYHQQVMDSDTRSNQTRITLEKFYELGQARDEQINISGNKVTIDMLLPEKRHIELFTDKDIAPETVKDSLYRTIYIKKYLVEKDSEEVVNRFYFHGKPINPRLLDELNGGWYTMSDGPSTSSIDLEAASTIEQFGGASTTEKGMGFTDTEVLFGVAVSRSFSYSYLGKTTNGVHVLRAVYMENQAFSNILFVRFKVRKGFDYNGDAKDQLLICLESYYPESYGSIADVTIKGNAVKIDLPERPTPVDEPTDTTHVVFKF